MELDWPTGKPIFYDRIIYPMRFLLNKNIPFLLTLLLSLLFACKKQEYIPTGLANDKGNIDYIPVIRTSVNGEMDKVKNKKVILTGEFSYSKGFTASAITFGHCWRTSPQPTTDDAKTTFFNLEEGEFESSLTGLLEETRYYVRAYVIANGQTFYGEDISFVSKDAIDADNPNDPTSSWAKVTSFLGDGREGAVSFKINDLIYVGLGEDAGGYKQDCWTYNPSSDTWTQVANYGGVARSKAVAFSLDNQRAYVGTGWADSSLNDIWEFNPFSNNWYQRTPYPKAVHDATSFSIGENGYVGLGEGNSAFYSYNRGLNEWLPVADFPTGERTGAVGFSLGNYGYVGTGESNGSPQNDFWQYNLFTNQWTAMSNFQGTTRTGATGCQVSSDQGIIGLGYNGTHGYLTDVWMYNATYQVWSKLNGSFTGGQRFKPVSFSHDNQLYMGLGRNENNEHPSSMWKYSINK